LTAAAGGSQTTRFERFTFQASGFAGGIDWASDFDRANRWTKAGGVQPEDWPKWMRECKDY